MAAAQQDQTHTSAGAPEFPLGARCTKCGRFILGRARARRARSGRWRHESCDQAPAPGPKQFEELAEALMRSHPWPRLISLNARLVELDQQLAELKVVGVEGPIPEQPTGRHEALTGDRLREQELTEQRAAVQAAIDHERAWKAKRLAIDWVDGL